MGSHYFNDQKLTFNAFKIHEILTVKPYLFYVLKFKH